MRLVAVAAGLLALAGAVHAFSSASVRFHGTGGDTGVDRIKVRIDPPVPADVGAGDFTVELWLRGTLDENDTPTQGYRAEAQAELAAVDWIFGNIVIDRDIFGNGPDWGMSIHRDGAAAVLRFGTEGAGAGSQHTLQGRAHVLDGAWHHVAFVRQRASSVKRIWVDGALDAESAAGASTGDLSYPNGRATGRPESDPFLVFAAEKHGFAFSPENPFPSFAGNLDEIRVWSTARSGDELRANLATSLPPGTPGLVLYLRLEEGSGTALADAAGGVAARLFAGVPGNGEWSTLVPPGASSSTTSTTTVAGGTTSTTVAPTTCATDTVCDDGNTCTADRCEDGLCRSTAAPGVAGIVCELDQLVAAPLCPPGDGDAKLERGVDRRLTRARSLLADSVSESSKRSRRLRRRAAVVLVGVGRRVAKALRRARITSSCAVSIDTRAGVFRDAILAPEIS